MKSPKDMRIIQIDVTNACIHNCSNCTRFCGHHKRPFMMSMETFKRAVDSLDGYTGTIGLMGGEPTLNPHFEEMAQYLKSRRAPLKSHAMLQPQLHFMDAIHDLEMEHTFAYPCGAGVRQTVNGPGIWSTIGENYKKYYETIQDCCQYQALNDHSNAMFHQPALVSRKFLGIGDEEWKKMRDACWVQNLWSATVTPKGAFFCEVAGALDMLFDGPGGWPIEPGWWQRTPQDFGDQLHWCEICGLACHTFMRNANEEIDDVSPDIYEKLKAAGSRKVGTEHINILKLDANGQIAAESKAAISKRFSSAMPYTESYSARFNEEKTNLFFKKYRALLIVENKDELMSVDALGDDFEQVLLLVPNHFAEKAREMAQENSKIRVLVRESATIGKAIYAILDGADYNTYLLILDGKVIPAKMTEHLNQLVLNPGVLLYHSYPADGNNEYFRAKAGSTTVLLNGIAHSMREAGWDRILPVETLAGIKGIWQQEKVIDFLPTMARKAPTSKIESGKRYAIYGAGRALGTAIQTIEQGGGKAVAIIDRNASLWNKEEQGLEIFPPEYLASHRQQIDRVLISSTMYYREMKSVLLGMGYKEDEMAWV